VRNTLCTLWIDPEAINLSDRIIAGGRG